MESGLGYFADKENLQETDQIEKKKIIPLGSDKCSWGPSFWCKNLE